MSTLFSSLKLTGNEYDAFRVTRITSGEYAVIGSSIKKMLVAAVFTKDFQTFSSPQVFYLTTLPTYANLDINQASYIRPHVFQPYKNSPYNIVPPVVHLWFAPYTYNQPNYWLRYTHLTISSNLSVTKPGDLNNDGSVNLLDFNLLILKFGTPYTILDFDAIVSNYE